MTKIVQINSAINCGSTGKIAEQIGKLAVKQGWECYIAHSHRYSRDTELTDISTSRSFDEKIHYLGTLLTDRHGTYSRSSTKKLVEELEEIKPDLVHLHNIHGHYMNYPILFDYLKRSGVPVVWTLHDCWSFTGHCVYFDKVGCEKWKTQCEHCPQVSSYPKSLIDGSFKNFNHKKSIFSTIPNLMLVPVSDWLHELLKESFLKSGRIKTIHNGIDLTKFKPSQSSFREQNSLEGKFLVLGVADGYGDRKGLEEFNKLSEELGADYKVVMVGLLDEEKKRVSSKVLAMGRTKSQQDLIDIYSAADVYVNPTYEDNFPTTNLEALACGTPVITYRTGGSPEAIDEQTGLVVEKGDYKGLLSSIKQIKTHGKSFYQAACIKRAIENYDMNDRFVEYIELYKSILGKWGGVILVVKFRVESSELCCAFKERRVAA